MTDKEGTLKMQPSGRWAICRPGETPHESTSGDRFRMKFAGKLHLTRMEFRHSPRRGTPLPAIRCVIGCAPRSASMGKSSGGVRDSSRYVELRR
jgi:hypothetical protein